MSIVKIARQRLLLAAVCATQALADVPTNLQASSVAEAGAANAPNCRSTHTYQYRYHYRVYRPSPFSHPRAPSSAPHVSQEYELNLRTAPTAKPYAR